MTKIILSIPKVENNRVSVSLTASPQAQKYLTGNEFYIEYDENVEDVPISILMVPFLYNLVPISWFKDIVLEVPILDGKTFESLAILKKNMSEIHGNTLLKGSITVKQVVTSSIEEATSKKAMLFSGGVDSWGSFLSHYQEKPYLCTVWGADIKLTDTAGWAKVKRTILDVCQQFDTTPFFVKTNFREIMNYFYIEEDLSKILTGNWWHDVQHGMGLTSLFAPLMYKHQVELLYVPGTFSTHWLEPIASEPRIDNHIKFGFSSVYHDQFDKNRQEKLIVVKDYYRLTGKKINIRVCYEGTGGMNCCICEKCNRTMIGLLVLGLNPKDFGFQTVNLKLIKKSISNYSWIYSEARKRSFQDIQQVIDPNLTYEKQEFIDWFNEIDFDDYYAKNQKSLVIQFKRRSKKFLKKMLKKVIQKS
ncbi:hypothetical protein RAK27_02025 [Carnobacterium maltaromaticum]|uniref:Uncharacterized protein n=1 Tax=Carnobacterium maltaromaticum TaxID=2751 RepID=A0AAW9JQ47_CARML|nr:hypothetical protein [Carnobacterium maltaromaticum]MDZ5757434.1 hypothetical protein [Carnobacterium maltaromaticum]